MRRSILFVPFFLAACGGSEAKTDSATTPPAPAPAPATPAPINLADVAGTWSGDVKPMDKDTIVTQSVLNATATKDGWTMTVGGGKPVPLTVMAVEGDSLVIHAVDFPSAVRKGQTVKTLHGVYHLADGKMNGVIHATYANGDTATFRSVSTKK